MSIRIPRSLAAIAAALVWAPIAAAAPTAITFTNPDSGDGAPLNVAAGPGDEMWFTYSSPGGTDGLGSISPDGVFTDRSSLSPIANRPYDLAKDADGNLWVTEGQTNALARISPAGTVTRFNIPTGGVEPTGVTVAPDGRVWFTAFSGVGRVGVLNPSTGQFTLYTTGSVVNGGPTDITVGADGNLWFTYATANAVGRITTSGTVTNFTSVLTGTMTTHGITSGPDGNLWVTVRDGSSNGAYARFTTGGVGTLFGAAAGVRPLGITVGGDNLLWAVDSAAPSVFGTVLTSPFATRTAFSLGTGVARGAAKDSQGNVWVASGTSPGKMTRIGIMPPVLGTATVTPSNTTAAVGFTLNGNGQATDYTVTATLGATTAATATGSISSTSSAAQAQSTGLTGLAPNTTYTYTITAVNGSGSPTPVSGTFTTAATPSAPSTPPASADPAAPAPPSSTPPVATDPVNAPVAPAPSLGSRVVADVSSGTVTVRLPGTSRFVPLPADAQRLPVGAVINAERGRVALTTALPGGRVQRAAFWGARFGVRQAAGGKGVITILMDARPLDCARTARRAGELAKPVRRRVLWGRDNHGLYRTQGRNSVATVRGTSWATIETCAGTITRVTSGAVAVRDIHTNRTVLVTAGESHLAPALR